MDGWTILGWVLGVWAVSLAAFTLYLWLGHQKRMAELDRRPPA